MVVTDLDVHEECLAIVAETESGTAVRFIDDFALDQLRRQDAMDGQPLPAFSGHIEGWWRFQSKNCFVRHGMAASGSGHDYIT